MRKQVFSCVGIFLLHCAVFLFAASGYEKVGEKKLFNGETLTEFKLKNGFRVLWVPRHQAKVLTFQIWFRVGSLNEKLDPKLNKTGLAHLFEHMMFRGSKKYPDGKFDEITARIGGEQQNATTYFYRTNYYESVPSKELERIMEVEADRMENLNLTEELFEKEKGAVVGELRRAQDSPSRVAWNELMSLMYRKAPFQWTVLGTEKEIKGFTLGEAQYFYRTFYSPNNATLIVVGDTEEKPLMELVVKYYGTMETQVIPSPPVPEEPNQQKEKRVEVSHKQATSEILSIGYHIPSVSFPDVVPLSLLSTHLSMGMEARLRKLLVDTGVAVNASAGVNGMPNMFQISVDLAENKKAVEALNIIDREINDLQTKPISKLSFERAKNQELLSLYDDISDNSALANWLGEYLMLCGNYMRGFEVIDNFRMIKPQDLERVAKMYLVKKNRSIVVVRPEKEGKS